MKSLGSALKEARELASLTLRQVEDATRISNAYLSQLENDKIKKPSANILYKLSELYKIELNSLLKAAGIINKSEQSKDSNEWLNSMSFYADKLTETERAEVLKYIKYLKFNRANA